jgi:hypothetical protein
LDLFKSCVEHRALIGRSCLSAEEAAKKCF